MRQPIRTLLPLLLAALGGCGGAEDLVLAPGWRAEVVAEWRDARPDMIVAGGAHLYVSCETRANPLAPSLARVDPATGAREILLHGLARADGLKTGPDGTLWLGEEVADGLVWRIEAPDRLPPGQRVDRTRLETSHAAIAPVPAAGRFAHEGLAFSADGRFLYLADEWAEGCLYRHTLATGRLEVLHARRGWLPIARPDEARLEAERLHGRLFARIEDMERLPDGRILMAETGAGARPGRILALVDAEPGPGEVTPFLEDARLTRPDNLAWDAGRGCLWITVDDDPSSLWRWNGEGLARVAAHDGAEITGVAVGEKGALYINLQGALFGPELTLRLVEAGA